VLVIYRASKKVQKSLQLSGTFLGSVWRHLFLQEPFYSIVLCSGAFYHRANPNVGTNENASRAKKRKKKARTTCR
jgi:hypothetical protein